MKTFQEYITEAKNAYQVEVEEKDPETGDYKVVKIVAANRDHAARLAEKQGHKVRSVGFS